MDKTITVRQPCSRQDYIRLRDRVLRDMRTGKDPNAYSEAVALLSPKQMGALHKAMNVCSNDLYQKDAEPW